MPLGTRCGSANILNTQLVSMYYRKTISQTSKAVHRNLILLQRSGSRSFTHHNQMLQMLRLIGMKYDTRINVFSDRARPLFSTGVRMFSDASIIVGPHGAGLSNLIFAKPGTVVIESVCTKPEQDKPNICFANLAFLLGHIYYGILPSGGCGQVTGTQVATPVNHYLEWLQHKKQS